MKSTITYFLFVAILCIPPKVFALHDFDILNFNARQIEENSNGRVFFNISIDIRNSHHPGKIFARVIALNKSGRVIKSHHIRGDFTADEVKTLSLRTFLEPGDYTDFDEWRLLETIKYGTQ